MSKLFTELVDRGIINNWANLLDWLFDDQKFERWESSKLGKYTKRLKKLPGIGKNNYEYGPLKNLSFPKRLTRQKIKILSCHQNSESKDWVRHIRNGIAHGKNRIINEPDGLWIEIKDFNKPGDQTAYYYIPIDIIFQSYKLYKEINRQP